MIDDKGDPLAKSPLASAISALIEYVEVRRLHPRCHAPRGLAHAAR